MATQIMVFLDYLNRRKFWSEINANIFVCIINLEVPFMRKVVNIISLWYAAYLTDKKNNKNEARMIKKMFESNDYGYLP